MLFYKSRQTKKRRPNTGPYSEADDQGVVFRVGADHHDLITFLKRTRVKTFYIQVVTEKEIDNTLTVEEHRTVPTHYLKLMEYETKMVRVDYKPGSESFDEKAFRQLMLSSIKKRYQKIVKVEVMDGLPHLE